jgi:methionyl aminopeptidase
MKNLSRQLRSWRPGSRGDGGSQPVPGPGPRRTRAGARIKSDEEIAGIRRACQLTRSILDLLTERVSPGVTTSAINRWVHDYTLQAGAEPAPLGYRGFPMSVCTSPNQVVAHGIPNDTPLVDGDILNIDVTCILGGFFGDASRMYVVGQAAPAALELIRVTRECLELGIRQVSPRATVGDIGHAIQRHAESHGYSIVRELAGHGTGLEFHEEPVIPHYGTPRTGPALAPNMVFTIEPMVNAGRPQIRLLRDGWTQVTVDGSLSAQWEHTVRVTATGVEVLTA